jgi:hypothetical protein
VSAFLRQCSGGGAGPAPERLLGSATKLSEGVVGRSMSAIAVAAQRGAADWVLALAQRGASVDREGPRGHTPLHYAAQSNSVAAVRAVLSASSDTDRLLSYYTRAGYYPVHTAVLAAAKTGARDIRVLSNGARVDGPGDASALDYLACVLEESGVTAEHQLRAREPGGFAAAVAEAAGGDVTIRHGLTGPTRVCALPAAVGGATGCAPVDGARSDPAHAAVYDEKYHGLETHFIVPTVADVLAGRPSDPTGRGGPQGLDRAATTALAALFVREFNNHRADRGVQCISPAAEEAELVTGAARLVLQLHGEDSAAFARARAEAEEVEAAGSAERPRPPAPPPPPGAPPGWSGPPLPDADAGATGAAPIHTVVAAPEPRRHSSSASLGATVAPGVGTFPPHVEPFIRQPTAPASRTDLLPADFGGGGGAV